MKNTTTTTRTTTRFTLNFRLLARVEGRRWLSKIKRNVAISTHHSSSRKQPSPQTSISQSQMNRDTTFDLPTKEDKKTMITTSKDNLPQQQPKYIVITDEDHCEQQGGKKVKNIKENVSEERNQEEIGLKHVIQGVNEEKRKNPTQESIETQLRKAQRREVLLARLRARIQKSEARFMHVEEQNHTCCEEARG
ncbi:unnamed protein product [Lactuca virosa]|uniref:Calmodulin-binding domain-containing protein n=1 Tax=Lactuca virosa TaxID=75947 RepID=A0AAU9NEX3_9ASTR|nr:unnamed protein product [Lactuca virosa]